MSTMTLARPNSAFSGTASASKQGATFSRARILGGRPIKVASDGIEASIEDRLANALRQASDAIRENTRNLGDQRAGELIARMAELLDPEEWDENDEIVKVGSVRTLVRTLTALDCSTGGIAITRAGNLAVSWTDDDENLRVEALPDGTVAWALVRQNGDKIEATHNGGDTIANLRSVCRA